MTDALLSAEEAAQYLGVTRDDLAIWRAAGAGPMVVRVGTMTCYRERDLAAWRTHAQAS